VVKAMGISFEKEAPQILRSGLRVSLAEAGGPTCPDFNWDRNPPVTSFASV
jgi:hypothetical protein